MTAAAIASSLGGRPAGSGWLASCPAHDDAHASLSISESGGKVLLHCHAGCEQHAVISALQERGLWNGQNGNGSARHEVARYDYKDADGVVRYQVVRLEPKDFRCYRPDTQAWSLKGVNPLPYRLPELATALKRGEPVVVVEGEKDADALTRLGMVATTNHGGVGNTKVWQESLAAHFPTGARAILLPDADIPGVKHMERVGEVLRAHGVEVLHVPPVALGFTVTEAHGKDVSDWLGAGHTRGELIEILSQAAPVGAVSGATLGVVLRDLADITPEPLRWLWPGVIPSGKVSMIVGDPGLGKSLVALDIAARVSKGETWPDGSWSRKGDTILLSAEDDPADTIRPRADAAGALPGLVHLLVAVRDGKRERSFNLAADVAALDSAIGNSTRLIIIDPLTAYLGGTDSHVTADVRGLLAPLADLAARRNLAILCVSHLNKSAGPAMYRTTGSLAFVAAARAVWGVARDQEDESRLLMLPIKQNLAANDGGFAYRVTVEGQIAAPRIQWEPGRVQGDATEMLSAGRTEEERGERQEAIDWLREALAGGPMISKDLQAQARVDGLSWATIRRAQAALGIKPAKDGHSGWSWALPSKMLTNGQDAQDKKVSILPEVEHLAGPKGRKAV